MKNIQVHTDCVYNVVTDGGLNVYFHQKGMGAKAVEYF